MRKGKFITIDGVEGVYDEINNKQYRYKEDSEQHIYSNSVDNVYDSASQAMYRTRDDDVDTSFFHM
jgi:hypothetical protein